MSALNDCKRLMPLALLLVMLCVISSTGKALSPEVLAPLAPEAPAYVARHKAALHKSINEGLKIKAAAALNREDVTRLLKQAADANKLPIAYLTRLIRQESSFDQNVVSKAGAQGIAELHADDGARSWAGRHSIRPKRSLSRQNF